MKNDKIIKIIKYNNNDLRFKIEMRLKVLYINFIIMKFINCDLYCIFVNCIWFISKIVKTK